MKTCIICGAKVRNENPRTVTCDPICTRAKHAGRTRQGQMAYEMEEYQPVGIFEHYEHRYGDDYQD